MKTMKKAKAKVSKLAQVFLSESEAKKQKELVAKGEIRQAKVYRAFNGKLPKYYKRTTDRVNKFDTLHDYFSRVGIVANTEHDFSSELHSGGLSPLDKSNLMKTYKLAEKGLAVVCVERALLIDPKERAESIKKGLHGYSKKFKRFGIVKKGEHGLFLTKVK